MSTTRTLRSPWMNALLFPITALAAVLLAGCPSSGTQVCADGRRCPLETICIKADDNNWGCVGSNPICGNNFIEAGELCDDGNTASGDRCSSTCQSEERCGDGFRNDGEECDCGEPGFAPGPECDSQNNSALGGYCRTDCRKHCGDGQLSTYEICDGELGTLHCTDFGYAMGHLACSPVCDDIELGNCSGFDFYERDSNVIVGLWGVWGSSSDQVFAVGESGSIQRFDGKRWQSMPAPDSIDLFGVWGSGPNNVYAVGQQGAILRYQGMEWALTASPTGSDLRGIWGSSPDNVYAVGASGTILHYDGSAWRTIKSPTSRGLWGISGSSADDVYAVGDSGTVLHFDGTAWRSMNIPDDMTLLSVWRGESGDVFAVGGSAGIWRYNGKQWQRDQAPSGEGGGYTWLQSVWGWSPGDVFAVGQNGAILHYQQGLGWQVKRSPSPKWLHSVWVSNTGQVIAVGEVGTILHYENTWTSLPSAPEIVEAFWASGPDDIYTGRPGYYEYGFNQLSHYDGTSWQPVGARTATAIWGRSATEVYAAGDALHIFDGTDWEDIELPSGPTRRLRPEGIWASSRDNVYVVGQACYLCRQGAVFHYDGTSVTIQELPRVDVLLAIWGSDPSNLFAVSASGEILHYSGTAWTLITDAPRTAALQAIWGSGSDNVFFVGNAGVILHYRESRWELMRSATERTLTSIWGSGPNDIYAAGEGQTLLHYDGVSWAPIATPVVSEPSTFQVAGAPPSELVIADSAGSMYRMTRAQAPSPSAP